MQKESLTNLSPHNLVSLAKCENQIATKNIDLQYTVGSLGTINYWCTERKIRYCIDVQADPESDNSHTRFHAFLWCSSEINLLKILTNIATNQNNIKDFFPFLFKQGQSTIVVGYVHNMFFMCEDWKEKTRLWVLFNLFAELQFTRCFTSSFIWFNMNLM